MTNMQSPPIWNTAAGVFQVNLDLDDYWKIQGIHFGSLKGELKKQNGKD